MTRSTRHPCFTLAPPCPSCRSLSSLKTVTSADIKRNRITFASTMRTGAPGPNALFDKHVPPGNKSVSVDPRHASPCVT